MKYRIHNWFNTQTGKPSFGIQCQVNKGEKFKHCGGTVAGVFRALIYVEEARAKEVVDAYNRGEKPEIAEGLTPLANA